MRALTEKQQTVLGYVAANGPASAADVASALLWSSAPTSVLDALVRRGLLDATYTGHHRGSGRAYEVTEAGRAVYDELFGDKPEDELSDEPLPLRITARPDGTYVRRYHDSIASYGLTWERLHPTEQAAVDAARDSEDGRATLRHVTAVVPRNR